LPLAPRARSTFLYVTYGVILLCLFGTIIGIQWPEQGFQSAENLSRLLGAVPDRLWWLFKTGYVGNTLTITHIFFERLTD
jgi:hypothetical protein